MTRLKRSPAQKLVGVALVVLLLLVALPLALFAYAIRLLFRGIVYLLVWLLWIPRGKDILFVYSDSPIWREYMTSKVLPLVQERAVVLNWSERRNWSQWSLGVRVFHHFGGSQEFNPLVVKFELFRRAKILRYWSAFKDWKRGYTEPVERLHNELSSIL